MIVEIESEQMDSAKHRAARKISERKSIPGFRPGKAPYDVVVRNFGDALISEEAVDILLDEVYPSALTEAKLEPAAAGSLEKVENLEKKPKFTFTVPLSPSVDLGKYRSIRLKYDWQAPGDEKVEEAVEDLRRMYAKTETVDRPIGIGDFVMLDLKGKNANPQEGEAPLIDRSNLPVFVRADGKEDEYPYAGFSAGLVGLKKDESKSFTHQYGSDHKDQKLQGISITLEVKINMVRGSILPELNDEFAKQVGPFENITALRDAVKANLSTQSKSEYEDEYFSSLIEKIKESATLKYPPQVVDHELNHVMEDLKSRLAQQNLDMVAYLKSREMDEEKFMSDEARPIAVKRLERSLIMDELARVEKIEVDRDLLQSSFEQTMGEYSGDARFQKTMRGKSQPPKQLMNAVAMESANRAYIQQTLNRLKEIANGQAPNLSEEKGKMAVKGKVSGKSDRKTIPEKKVAAAGTLPRESIKDDKKKPRGSSAVVKAVPTQKKSIAKKAKKPVSKS
jgi:trigger factor